MSIDPPSSGRSRLQAAVAAGLYLVLTLLSLRAVLHAPATTLLFPLGFDVAMNEAFWIDQQLVMSRVVEVAHTLGTRPGDLGTSGLCHPMPRAYTLGEHMFAEGLLALLPHALTGDPILTYNIVLGLSLWIAAGAMYALVYHWTRNATAAFLAGCFFAFHHLKTGDPVHPFVHANHWTALALLFAHQLFARGRWRDAAALAASLSLQLLESLYTVVSLTIIGCIYGGHLALHHLRRLPALAPKLLACAAAVLLVAIVVFGPYLHSRAAWGLLSGRRPGTHTPADFGPGRRAFPGYLPAALAVVALVDRVRRGGRRVPDDPRLPLLAAGVYVAWASMGPFAVPGTSVVVPAPLDALRGIIPGVDAVRAGWAVGDGVQLIVAVLAGFGAARILTTGPRWLGGIAAPLLVTVTLLDILVPRSIGAFPGPLWLATWTVRTPEDLLDLTVRLPTGAVLDIPYMPGKSNSRMRAHYLLLSAYHLRPTAACHYSFSSPLGVEIDALVRRLPDVGAADALYALGFRSVVVHHEGAPGTAASALAALAGLGRAREVATAIGHTAYVLETPLPVRTGLNVLTPDSPPEVVQLGGGASRLTFTFLNATTDIYRHPDPLEPTRCLVRWYAASGRLVATDHVRVLLPLALGAGDRATKELAVRVPLAAGDYEVTLAPVETPDTVVGRLRVHVEPRSRAAK